jgi:hypothetical protein
MPVKKQMPLAQSNLPLPSSPLAGICKDITNLELLADVLVYVPLLDPAMYYIP